MQTSVKTRGYRSGLVVTYGLMLLFGFIAVGPLLWMISTAFKPASEMYRLPIQWIPQNPTFEHFAGVLNPVTINGQYFGIYFANSMIVSTCSSILSVVIAASAAYAFSRFDFPGRNITFFAVLVRNMFPLVVFLIPLFFLMRNLRLLNTYQGLILAYLTFTLPLSIWLLKGFFDGIPHELEDAARVDGCTRFAAFRKVVLPLALPGLAATAIYSFVQAWNEFPLALQLTSSTKYRTLPVGLSYFFSENSSDWGGLMASSVLISIPVVIMFMFLNRFFISALTQGAVKG